MDSHPDSPSWGYPSLPGWVTDFRPAQLEACQQILDHYKAGRKVVFLDAPTGTGKTLIAEMVRRQLRTRSIYSCTTKTLQDQMVEDFRYAALLKGRSNYPTFDHPDFTALTAAECNRELQAIPVRGCTGCDDFDDTDHDHLVPHCSWCHPVSLCPYIVARDAALRNPTVLVTNTAYMLTEMNGPGRLSVESKGNPYGLVVIDEADSLEQLLMAHIEFEMPRSVVKSLKLKPPDRKTVPSAWWEWVYDIGLPALQADAEEKELLAAESANFRDIKRAKAARHRLERLTAIAPKLFGQMGGDPDWVYTGYDKGNIAFKPVTVSDEGQQRLWRHGKRWLLMSATIISPQQMASDLGLQPKEWATVSVESGFDPRRRPVFVSPVASMTYSQREAAWPKMAAGIRTVIDRYPLERILVHTVSYDLAQHIVNTISSPRILTYGSSADKDEVIARYLRTPNAVLVAASLERGIDLPDGLCRVVVVAKIPYPSLNDRQIAARLHKPGGQSWYSMQTVRAMVQMAGRGMRHEDDWCDVWILDQQFGSNLWSKQRHMIPDWFSASLEWHPSRWQAPALRGLPS